MTGRAKKYRLKPDEALRAAAEIIARGHDVELRSVDGGKRVIVYELHKKVHEAPGLNETPD